MKCVNDKLTPHEKAILTMKALAIRKKRKEELYNIYMRERQHNELWFQ